MMVGFILTSVLLLVLPSLICGTTTRINVTDSGSLQLSSFPDNLTISDSLNVTCIYTGKDKPGANDLRLNIKVTDNLLTPLYYEDNKKIGYDMEADSYTKNVQVTFSSSSGQMALQEQPIRVTVSTSFHDISVEVTSNITDNRVGIGFPAESEQIRTCYLKKPCDLAVNISHSNDNFSITIDLRDSGGKNVSQTTLPVGGGVYHQTVTLPEQGRFIANLSVADKNIENRVYWSKKTLLIDVVANVTELQNSLDNLTKLYQILWGMYQNLSKEYNELKSQVDSLPTAPAVVRNNCDEMDCGDHGECVKGVCICERLYGGDDCSEYIPCQSDPCGTRGTCHKPDDNPEDYECKCISDDVIGDNCTVCKAEYCNEPNGVCSVGEDGQPNCTCNVGYTGDSCEFKECNNSTDCGENSMVCNEESHCVCQKGYLGKDCQAICSFNPCGSGGDCLLTEDPDMDYYECECHPGYSGRNCTTDVCSNNPCLNDGTCVPDSSSKRYKCTCQEGFSGEDCGTTTTTTESDSGVVPTAVYQQPAVWAIAIFIVVLAICVLAYIGYHNRNKILELFGGKKESVVEMAMRSRTKKKGYKKLPTSIHDTLTHED